MGLTWQQEVIFLYSAYVAHKVTGTVHVFTKALECCYRVPLFPFAGNDEEVVSRWDSAPLFVLNLPFGNHHRICHAYMSDQTSSLHSHQLLCTDHVRTTSWPCWDFFHAMKLNFPAFWDNL